MLNDNGPRKIDLPTLKPQQWDKKAGEQYVNDLHHLMGNALEAMTGNPKPSSADLLEYIQDNYKELFDSGDKKSS